MAIENGIEVEHATQMLKLNQLIPAPSIHFEKWPWPVRVFCFDTFAVEIQGKKLEATGKGQMKILELLQCIIAFGGREVESYKLSNVLWPLSDGDTVHHSMETALHRLRKIIGKETVIVKAGKISLNERHCWIDQWAFEQIVVELDEALNSTSNHKLIKKLTDRLFNIYRGSFLGEQNSGWEQLKREQQQNRLLNLIERLSLYYEKHHDVQYARYLLKKGIELALLLESGYMLLMKHYMNLEQPNNALNVYLQCENTFKAEFGIQLSPKMQKLATPIHPACPSRASG